MTRDYYGTKRVTAWKEDREVRTPGITVPQPGYAVKYADGYISWSPKDVFEAAYQPLDALSFGHALVAMKERHKVCRAGWNAKGMFIVLMSGYTGYTNADIPVYETVPFIAMKTVDDKMVPWMASQTDVLANDWRIVE